MWVDNSDTKAPVVTTHLGNMGMMGSTRVERRIGTQSLLIDSQSALSPPADIEAKRRRGVNSYDFTKASMARIDGTISYMLESISGA